MADEVITVSLAAKPVSTTRVYAVQEQVPSGWTVLTMSDGGEFDAKLGRIKWGPLFTNGMTTFRYQIKAPSMVVSSVTFSGTGSFDGLDFPTTGRREMIGLTSRVVRHMATEFLASAPFAVTNRVTPDHTVKVYAVEDQLPEEVRVSGISHDGVYDSVTRRVKWGPFLDAEERALEFTVQSSNPAGTVLKFSGTGSFNRQQVTIAGQQEIRAVSISQLNTVLRSAPASVRASRSITVTNRVTIGTSVAVYAIEDQLPAGWTATNITHDGVFDSRKGKVKWGPFFDGTERELTYRALAPPSAGGRVTFKGTASFNGEPMALAELPTVWCASGKSRKAPARTAGASKLSLMEQSGCVSPAFPGALTEFKRPVRCNRQPGSRWTRVKPGCAAISNFTTRTQ